MDIAMNESILCSLPKYETSRYIFCFSVKEIPDIFTRRIILSLFFLIIKYYKEDNVLSD